MIELLLLLWAAGARRASAGSYYGDVQTAAAVFAANPALADDPEALANAAGERPRSIRPLDAALPAGPGQARSVPGGQSAPRRGTERTAVSSTAWTRASPTGCASRRCTSSPERATWKRRSIFIDHGADLARARRRLLFDAAGLGGQIRPDRMVEFLLRRGAKPNLPDDPPWATPLAWATRRGHQRLCDC